MQPKSEKHKALLQMAVSLMAFIAVFFAAGMLSSQKTYAATEKYSGTSGTVKWVIDSDGVLTFSPVSVGTGTVHRHNPNQNHKV